MEEMNKPPYADTNAAPSPSSRTLPERLLSCSLPPLDPLYCCTHNGNEAANRIEEEERIMEMY